MKFLRTLLMRQSGLLALTALIASAPPAANAAPEFRVNGRRVAVETERYRAVVDGLAVVSIENRLTGEVYARPGDGATSASMEQMFRDQGVLVETLRPDVPDRRYGLCDRTQVRSKIEADRVVMTYLGLQHGAGEDARFEEEMTIELTIAVDPANGDLVITPTVRANIEPVFGARDRGVQRMSLHVLNLAHDLKIILPVGEGHAWTAAPESDLFTAEAMRWNWPMHWEAGLAIAEGGDGCLGIWAVEPRLDYGRHLALGRSHGRWNLGFDYETTDMIYRCDRIENASWRINVFKGYWIKAAEPYVRQMENQWNMAPLAKKSPEWASRVRVVLPGLPSARTVERYAKLLPKDAIAILTTQGWAAGYAGSDGYERGCVTEGWWPNYPFDNPTRYEARPGIPEDFTSFEEAGAHVFPYTAPLHIYDDHPWKKKMNNRANWAWPFFQRFYIEQCLDLVERYGVSGIYEDVSWVHQRHWHGKPDDYNVFNGAVRMRELFHNAMPNVALMGERNNELTARGHNIALCWIPEAHDTRHPICGYLFNRFILRWNLGSRLESYDDEDITGFTCTTWPTNFDENPMQEARMIRARGLVFATQQLESYWPETWDPEVMHYFKGKEGAEYRFVRDRGTRFVKMNGTQMETIYWRLCGAREVTAPGVGIEGWIGYDGDRIIGLNPHAPLYVTVEGVERPPAVICDMPEGFAMHRTLIRDGYWAASIAEVENLMEVPPPEAPEPETERAAATLRVRADRPVSFLGVESVREIAGKEYEVTVKLPGGFACTWDQPSPVETGHRLGSLPAVCSIHGRATGLISGTRDADLAPGGFSQPWGVPPGDETSLAWLLTLPAEPVRLALRYGTGHGYGDGANYMVRVNGCEIWKAYRRQISEEAEKAQKNIAPPIGEAVIDLSEYAGQPVVLELALNGNLFGISETTEWHTPRLEAIVEPNEAREPE
jgi:hypothetical protein